MIETVEKRQRRIVRERRKLAAFRHALRFFSPVEALKNTYGLSATWDSVRRVASALLSYPVKDIGLAWQIVYYIRHLPDGAERLEAATNEVLAQWKSECRETS